MSEKSKKNKPKAILPAASKHEFVAVTLPSNPTEDDVRKATTDAIAKTQFHQIEGCNDLIGQVDVQLLCIDYTYQRSMDKKAIKEFDKSRCDVLLVSYRNGLLYIIDGQHRLDKATSANVRFLLVRLVNGLTGLTLEEEAKRFYEQNEGKVPIATMDGHKSALVYGEPVHTTLQRHCDKHGLKVTKGGAKRGFKFNCVEQCCSLLKSFQATGGQEAMDAFLEWLFGIYENAGWMKNEWIGIACTAKFINALGIIYRFEYNRVSASAYDPTTDTPSRLTTYAANLATVLKQLSPENLELYARGWKHEQELLGLKPGDERIVLRQTLMRIAEGQLSPNMVLHLQFNL